MAFVVDIAPYGDLQEFGFELSLSMFDLSGANS